MKRNELLTEEQIPSSTSHLDIQQNRDAKNENNIPQLKSPVQINEITSSDDEKTPPPLPRRPPGGHGALSKRKLLCQKLADQRSNADSVKTGNFTVFYSRIWK